MSVSTVQDKNQSRVPMELWMIILHYCRSNKRSCILLLTKLYVMLIIGMDC